MSSKPTYGRNVFRKLTKFLNWEGGWESDRLCRQLQLKLDGVYVVSPPPEIARHLALTELEEMEKHPLDDLAVPALAFPFTLDEFDAFIEFYGIYDCCDMKLLLKMMGKIFTREQVAEILEIDTEDVTVRTQSKIDSNTGKPCPVLQPSKWFSNPMKLCRQVTVKPGGDYGWGAEYEVVSEDLYGLFDLEFLRSMQFDENGRVTFHRLERDGKVYSLATEEFESVNAKDFVFTSENLRSYMKAIKLDPVRLDSLTMDRQAGAVDSRIAVEVPGGENGSVNEEPQVKAYLEVSEDAIEMFSSGTWLIGVVRDFFWSKLKPDYNRPTKEQIVDWLVKGYAKKGITPTEALRIYRLSKPDSIPDHGNLPNKLSFPDPVHPPFPR